MFGLKSMAVGSIAAVVLAVGAPVAQATTGMVYPVDSSTTASSADWAGWDVTGGSYTSVSAAWTVPTVTCTAGETSYSADWVGLDGDGSNSVEQTGTSSDCDTGTPTYSAWYEFYPSVAVTLPNSVKAGDKITASVASVKGTDRFELVLTDLTQKWTKTETGDSPSGTGASAEVVAEAPSGSERSNSVLPLADFKTVTFSDVLVNGKAIGTSSSAAKITLVDSSESPMATVSALTGNNKFTVSWVSSGDSSGTASTIGQPSGGGGFPGGGSGYGYGYGSGAGDGSGATSSVGNDWSITIGEGYGAGYGSWYYWQS